MLRSLDLAGQPKSRKAMDAGERHYVDVVVPKQEEALKRRRAKSEREIAKDAAYQAMTEGHRTPEQVAKHLGWTIEKARFICADTKS